VSYLLKQDTLEPVQTCGCGDIGYLTARTLPVDLAHGVGTIHHVPVYHCREESCAEYTIPYAVSRRLEELAEQMESSGLDEIEFSWKNGDNKNKGTPSIDGATEQAARIQAFTLKFLNREYEDARVILVVPGENMFLQSNIDPCEYYLLRYEPNAKESGIWFSFSKFYYDEPNLTYESFLNWSEDGYIKELAVLALEEIEETLIDEFGEIV